MSEQNPPQAPQPPQSSGSAPAGSESVGAAPGGSETIGQAPPPVEPTPKKKSALPRILIAVGILAVLLIAGLWLSRDDAINAEVGSCFDDSVFTEQLTDASGATTVDCADASAKYKVVGIVEDKLSSQMNVDADCGPYPTAVAGIWLGKQGEAGKVFCVEEVVAS